MMNEQAVADGIFANAQRYAARRHHRLGEGADQHFRFMARLAAGKIAEEGRNPNARRALRAKATRNFRKMIDAMIEARADAYAGDAERLRGNIIGEATLAIAHAKLCPIWPFC
jgi:hypothetical protein